MRVLVVYESMFGNTEAVARAVAEGLGERMDVELHEVGEAPVGEGIDLIVAGGPTHAFSLSRPSTRAEAIAKGATADSEKGGLREWLSDLPRATQSVSFAAFDTRVDKVRHLPGSAAAKAAKIARRLGYAPAGHQSFYVTDTMGPLLPGELERAKTWGEQVAAEVDAPVAEQTGG